MDNQIISSFTQSIKSDTPAYLFIGEEASLATHAKDLLRSFLCSHATFNTGCISCEQIERSEHHAVRWYAPEKNAYSIDEVHEVLASTAYLLSPGDHHMIVIQDAHTLSIQGANALLKSLEEPPAGYHFILLAAKLDAIPATIRSRCLIYQVQTSGQSTKGMLDRYPFLNCFLPTYMHINPAPLIFTKELETSKIDDRDSSEALHELLHAWKGHMLDKISQISQAQELPASFLLLQKSLAVLPMPGSSKIFWRNLFLTYFYL